MILDGRIGMFHRNEIETRIAGKLCCLEKQFEVHHVVDDHRKTPAIGIVIPRAQAANCFVEACAQCFCRLDHHS
jgi:hypothetical protein